MDSDIKPQGRKLRDGRPDPDALLARVMKAEGATTRGRHKIFLGFAAGVGKTYEMLSEASRRRLRGQDVVIGFVETHGRQGTQDQIGDLEIVPRRQIPYRNSVFEEMDTDAILTRKPVWALVDELAHTNVPGSTREKRWQDVEVLLSAGISVLSTLNVQHLESLNDTVREITGVWVRETIPDRVVMEADEVMMVDITPRALIHRLERGDIYSHDKIPQALSNWFQEGNLNALREIALREIAQEVDEDVTAYRKHWNVQGVWSTQDRIMVCVSPSRSSLRLLRRGWRIAKRMHAEIVAVYVEEDTPGAVNQEQLQESFALADRLGIQMVTLHGDVVRELIYYARQNQITQIVIGRSNRSRWHEIMRGSVINHLTSELRSVDILIVGADPDP